MDSPLASNPQTESLLARLRSYGPGEIAVLTFGVTALAAVLTPVLGEPLVPLVAVVPVVGWFLLTPLAAMRGWGEEMDEAAHPQPAPADPADDPVERLRQRYADGEIDEVEFERQLETLLATENADPETAREEVARQTELE